MNDSSNADVDEYTHYHRTCQRCGKNWWGLHCPHDGMQNPCPECESVPVVLNAHYCDCEFVIEVDQLKALLAKQTVAARIDELQHRRKRFEVPEQVFSSDGRHKRPAAEGRNKLKALELKSIDNRLAQLTKEGQL